MHAPTMVTTHELQRAAGPPLYRPVLYKILMPPVKYIPPNAAMKDSN